MSEAGADYFAGPADGEARPGEIQYVNGGAAPLPFTPYEGNRYADRVPDTYDVAGRAALAVNALVGSTNPLADHELYWKINFAGNPVTMNHDWNDWCQVKFMEALPLLRIASGSRQGLAVDPTWQAVTLKSLGPDGLYYVPLAGRPWAWLSSCWAEGVARADGSLAAMGDPATTQITHMFVNGRMLGTLLVYWLRGRDPAWLAAIYKMVDRMAELAVYREDYAYYPALVYEPGAVYDKTSPAAVMPVHLLGGETTARVPESLGKVYRLTGYQPARILGEKLVRYVQGPMAYYGPGGEFLGEKHFHAHTIYLLSMLEFATATGDWETIEFVRRGYEWAKTRASAAADELGFFPEVADAAWPSAESCEIADMIALALKLSAAGAGDYFNDAERWTRNHFAEAQLTEADWVNAQAACQPAHLVLPNETAQRTAERNVGAFAQGSGGNEFWVKGPDGIVHCCTGNGARTLYYLWEECLWYSSGVLRVNLLLNRASPWVDVYSYIPNQGRVDLRVKQACAEVQVHAPAWVQSGEPGLIITVDGAERPAAWVGRFLAVGPVQAGQLVRVEFPIAEWTTEAVMGTKPYRVLLRGDTVVAVDPPGVTGALYRREHLRQVEPGWKEVTRFIPDERLDY